MGGRSRFRPEELLRGYDLRNLSIGSIASHSALDVFDGAKDEGFRTVAVCEVGRERTYSRFGRVVDVALVLEKFSKVVEPEVVGKLRELNTVFIPNRSFSVYVGYDAIESPLRVPVFGNRYLLRYEERIGRGTTTDYSMGRVSGGLGRSVARTRWIGRLSLSYPTLGRGWRGGSS
jgi:5-formaminoimidazole-4-carboxamide-1-(beta)-D-ribofuranosyl 5'-monophosphate synthetase